MTMIRDSVLLWIGFGAAAVGFLVTAERPPLEWSYQEWLQALSFMFAWLMGKLATSPLPGK